MKIVSKLFSLPVIIVLVWMGANIYQDNELFANPFVKQSILDKMERSHTDIVEEKIEQAGDAAKETLKEGIDGLGDKLKCGTNCGSCKSELQQLINEHSEPNNALAQTSANHTTSQSTSANVSNKQHISERIAVETIL